MSVKDVTLKRQVECYMLRGFWPLHNLLLLGYLPSTGPASLFEGRCQDLLGLRAEATCKAQRESLSLCYLVCTPATLDGHLYWPTFTLPYAKPGSQHPFCFPLQPMDP